MRFVVLMKATPDSEAGVMPSTRMFAEMGRFNEELVNAGVMKAGEGLHPTARGARVEYGTGAPTVKKGPFPNSPDLVAGFWIWEVPSLDEAIAWAKRVPNSDGVHRQVEIRQIMSAEDFGDALTPELRAQEAALRARSESP